MTAFIIFKVMANMMTGEDFTCSDVVLGPEEVRVLVDDFDDVNNQLVEIKKIMDEFEKKLV